MSSQKSRKYIAYASLYSAPERELQKRTHDNTKHPLKFYYIRSKNSISIVDTYKIFSPHKTCYYTVDQYHTYLIKLINNLGGTLEKCEPLFYTYIEAVKNLDFNALAKIYSEIISTLQNLHPFFKYETNVVRYFQSVIINYFCYTIEDFLTCENVEQNEEYMKFLLHVAVQPWFNIQRKEFNQYTIPIPQHSSEFKALWDEFRFLAKDLLSTSPFIKGTHPMPHKNTPIMYSLYGLEQVLTYYTFDFLDMIQSDDCKLSKGQLLYLFMLAEETAPLFQALEESQLFHTPSVMSEILGQAIENKNRKDGIILIDNVYEQFDSLSDYAISDLINAADYSDRPQAFSAAIRRIHTAVDKKWDTLFETEIYEVYTFEQLIYLEIYHLLQEEKVIKKCKTPECNTQFISHKKNNVFCRNCAIKQNGSNKLYRQNKSEAARLRDKEYQHYSYKIRRESDAPKKKQYNDNFSAWVKESKTLVDNCKSDNQEDIVILQEELNKLSKKHNLYSLKQNSKKFL